MDNTVGQGVLGNIYQAMENEVTEEAMTAVRVDEGNIVLRRRPQATEFDEYWQNLEQELLQWNPLHDATRTIEI